MLNFFKWKRKTEPVPANVRAFNAAMLNAWNRDLMTQCVKTNDDIRRNGDKLRDISREMAKNCGDYRKYLNLCCRNIVGDTGIKLQMNVRLKNGKKDHFSNRVIEEEFNEFSRFGNCTCDRRFSMRLLDELIVRTHRIDGEVFLRRVRGFGNKHRFAFQILDSAACPRDLNFLTRDRHRVRMGIEFNEWDEPLAYYFYASRRDQLNDFQPYETVLVENPDTRFIRIPAAEINHIFTREFPGQIRGFPFGQSAIQDMNLLATYHKVELVAADAASRKLGKLVNKNGIAGYTARNGSRDDVNRPQMVTQEAGSIDILNGDWDLLMYSPQHPAGNFPPFVESQKRNISNGLDVAYNTFANDLRSVNFSSIRSAVLDERDAWKCWQEFFVECYKTVEFSNWLEIQLLRPDFRFDSSAFDRLNKPVFLCRRWQWVDPVNDGQANILQMAIGSTNPYDIAANLGNDFDENIEAISEAVEKLKPVMEMLTAVNRLKSAFDAGGAGAGASATEQNQETQNNMKQNEEKNNETEAEDGSGVSGAE